MRVKQYVTFSVFSKILSPEHITEVLGLDPSRAGRRGSRQESPPIPVFNVWTVRSQPNRGVGAMLTEIVDLIEPLADRLAALRALDPKDASGEGLGYGITVVRYFNARDGVEEEIVAQGDLVKMPGQHQLLSFSMEPELMLRLSALGCDVDFDEYG